MRILFIEDEVPLAEAVCEGLKKENYITDLSFDGESGYYNALSGIYDLIITDIMLPKKNGYDIVRDIRREGIKTPVIILSAKSEIDDKINGLDCGADDYMTKPFSQKELCARIRALLRRPGEIVDDSFLTFNDLSLDTQKGEVSCTSTKKSVKLGVKELNCLEMLLKNQNRIVTKEQLFEGVWGTFNQSEYNNVEVYISFLRKKIAFVGAKVRIRSSRGLGYSLEAVNSSEG